MTNNYSRHQVIFIYALMNITKLIFTCPLFSLLCPLTDNGRDNNESITTTGLPPPGEDEGGGYLLQRLVNNGPRDFPRFFLITHIKRQ